VRRGPNPIAIATWKFGLVAVNVAGPLLERGASALDAVEAGIRAVEADPKVDSVGFGSLPNAQGIVELDAAIIEGSGLRAGSVAALRATKHPISVARAVMERTPHVMLVGEGARLFARAQGFPAQRLLTRAAKKEWLKRRCKPSHDTVAVLALDSKGDLAAGCSTSGLAGKLPGRVGDSPIIGAGLYCDNRYGAAAATGRGEFALRIAASHLIVMLMAQGLSPKEACERCLREVRSRTRPPAEVQLAVLALSPEGRYAGAALRPGFEIAAWQGAQARLESVVALTPKAETRRRKGVGE